jgi:hypothetical protein
VSTTWKDVVVDCSKVLSQDLQLGDQKLATARNA